MNLDQARILDKLAKLEKKLKLARGIQKRIIEMQIKRIEEGLKNKPK